MGAGKPPVKLKSEPKMGKTLFEIECFTDGHTYIIRTDDSDKSLDLEKNGLVDILYRWSNDDGPLELEDVCDILDSFCGLKNEFEVHKILNEPRFSSTSDD